MALAVFVIANDFTSLTVGLPQVERTFHTNLQTVEWVLNAYVLVFGVLIVTGGRLDDAYGHRRTFFAGIARPTWPPCRGCWWPGRGGELLLDRHQRGTDLA
jgi:MFS family permease